MIKLTKEQKESIKELERIEEEQAGEEEYRRSQESEYEGFDNYSHQTEHPHDPHSQHHSEQYDLDDTEGDNYLDGVQGDSETSTYGTSTDEPDYGIEQAIAEDMVGKMIEEEIKKEEEEMAEEEKSAKYEYELRANIAFEKEDGSIISSFIENYGGGVGWTLNTHYNDEKSALKVSEIGHISELHQTINETIKNRHKKKRTQELQIFDNYDEYDKYIIKTRDIDCAYLWRNKSWNVISWIFEYNQSDFGVDILKDEFLPTLILSSTSLKKEKNKSKFIKNFNDGKWKILSETIPEWLYNENSDELPF